MNRVIPILLLLGAWLAGCATIPEPHGDESDAQASAILDQAATAHGYVALQRLRAVDVRLEGKFNWVVTRVQPTLCDKQFRGTSDEQYLVHEPVIEQQFVGTGGAKKVYRDKNTVRVWYNGSESTDSDVRDAAALVADNYRMFLFGPAFFTERGAHVHYVGTETVDGFECDNLLTELKPGIGNSKEDRVVISVDRRQHIFRRLRITVNGLSAARGAIADIYLRDPIRIGGVIWPTRFYEVLKKPFPSPVHSWRLTGIELDQGTDKAAGGNPSLSSALAAATSR